MPATPSSNKLAQSTQQEDDDSAEDDDDFLANIEELPDTDELEEDEMQAEDSDEPPYEPEMDILHLGADGASIASGTPAEASLLQGGGRNKRRRLSAGTPASDATAPPSSSRQRHHQAAEHFAAPAGATAGQPWTSGSVQQQQHGGPLPRQELGHNNNNNKLQQQMQDQLGSLSSVLQQHAQLPPRQQQQSHHKQNSRSAENPKEHHLQQGHLNVQHLPGQLAGQQPRQHTPPMHQREQPAVQQPHQRLSQPVHQQHRPQTRSQHRSPTATSTAAATPSIAASESANAPQDDDAGDDAICLRTRSKHPLASEEFDPDMFDRLLAEFDPDVEPLIDDAMYQQFLQSLQNDGPPISQLLTDTSSLLCPTPAAAAPTAGLDSAAPASPAGADAHPPSASAAGPAVAGGLSNPSAVMTVGVASEDDEDDEEFQLDPLDWLLDDERDAEEEERLAQLVQVQAQTAAGDAQHSRQAARAAVQTPGFRDHRQAGFSDRQRLPGQYEGLAAGERRRSQREAARRAAARIAQEQQQQRLQHQAGSVTGVQGLDVYVQPLIPAAAAGWPLSAAALVHPGAAVPLQHAVQQQLSMQDTLLQPTMAAAQPAHVDLQHQQQQYLDPASNADLSMPPLLTLSDNQLKQLYQQISLHTQLLTQLYVLTARDASSTAQAVASSAGQMLGDIKRLHAAASGSYRGGQLAELLQQAFIQGSSSSFGGADGTAPAGVSGVNQSSACGSRGGAGERSVTAARSRIAGSNAASAATIGMQVWRPPISNMTTVWDTVPLRLLDDVVSQLRVTPMCAQPLLDRLQQQEVGSSRNSGNSSRAAQQAAREAKQLIDTVLGPVCKGPAGYDASAWPLLAPRGKAGIWGTAEDDLLWLGIIRFHNAVRPMQDTAQLISQELLPSKSAASILTRYRNIIRRRHPTADLVLKYAFVGKERPTGWEVEEPSEDQGSSAADAGLNPAHVGGLRTVAAAAADTVPRTSRGPMWAAAELGAALTAAFAAAELGLPSAAAAAAAGVLLQDASVASADDDAGDLQSDSVPTQAVDTGEQLLQDSVAATSVRLPFVLPAPLEVPSASSIRRAPLSLRRTADRAAGEHLLLSLVARQILQGDPDTAAADAATLAGDAAGHGAAADAAGVAIGQGLLAGLFPVGPCSTDQQLPSAAVQAGLQQQGGAAPEPTMTGHFTALLQASPAPRKMSTSSPSASAVAADSECQSAGAARGHHNMHNRSSSEQQQQQQQQNPTTGTIRSGGQQQPRQREQQQLHQHPVALQQGSVCMIGGSLAYPFGLAGPRTTSEASGRGRSYAGCRGPQPFGTPSKHLHHQRQQPQTGSMRVGASGAASRMQQAMSGSGQPQQWAARSGSSAAAAAAMATAAAAVDTEDEDMNFGDPASESTSAQKQQQPEGQQHQNGPARMQQPAAQQTRNVSATNPPSTQQADAAAGGGAVDGGKQLRRSLFGSSKPAAASAAALSGTQHTSLAASRPPQQPPAATATAAAAQGLLTACQVSGSSQELRQRRRQRQPQPSAPRATAAGDAQPAVSSSSGAAYIGQSVFSAAAAAYAPGGACVGIGLGLEPWPGASTTAKAVGKARTAAGPAGASIPASSLVCKNSLNRSTQPLQQQQHLTAASAAAQRPAMATNHPRDAASLALTVAPAAVSFLKESVTARAARRLAAAEAQDAALLAATAAALPTAQLSSNISHLNKHVQLSDGAQAANKKPGGRGRRRRTNLAPLNACAAAHGMAPSTGCTNPAAAGSFSGQLEASVAAGQVAPVATALDHVSGLHASAAEVAQGSAAAGSGAQHQAGSGFLQDGLLDALQNALQLSAAGANSTGVLQMQRQMHGQQPQQASQGTAGGFPGPSNLQDLLSGLLQGVAGTCNKQHNEIDVQAVYAVLAQQQQQQDEERQQQAKSGNQLLNTVQEQPTVDQLQQQQQEPMSPLPKHGSRTSGSARKQKRQNRQQLTPAEEGDHEPSSQRHPDPQIAAGNDSCGVLDFSALQALAEAAANAAKRLKK